VAGARCPVGPDHRVPSSRAGAAALAEIPGVRGYTALHPRWLYLAADLISRGLAPLTVVLAALALVWLCVTGRWTPGGPASAMASARAGLSARA